MSVWIKWTPTHQRMWDEWIASRPPVIQDLVTKYNLQTDRLYRLKSTNQRVILQAITEDGKVRVAILAKYNQHLPMFEYLSRHVATLSKLPDHMLHIAEHSGFTVFGIDPADLEECEWDGEVEDGAEVLRQQGIPEDPNPTIH